MEKATNNKKTDKNILAQKSPVYKNVYEAYYNTDDPKERFDKCYRIIDAASYHEIHFIITYLKGMYGSSISDSIPSGGIFKIISKIINQLNQLFGTAKYDFLRYIFDILVEARGRK
ncbi:MAG: hypothetical protein II871_08340 [Clostridia bacterium]|nr:hypothetical protein [Clostridia bacterium]